MDFLSVDPLPEDLGTVSLQPARARGSPTMTGTRRSSLKNQPINSFYTPLFHSTEVSGLDHDQNSSLEGEIAMLRVMIRRTLELAGGINDLAQATRLLNALGAAASRLANLMRLQAQLRESPPHLVEEISSAIQQLNSELRRKHE